MDSCKDCTHFRQHYVLSAGVYVPLNYGHCVARRRKKLQADSECCEHFMRVEKEEVWKCQEMCSREIPKI